MSESVTIFLSGDVMTGRGIDQIFPHPSDPVLHESYVKFAWGYVELAERKNGAIPKQVKPVYIWGDFLKEITSAAVNARIINLETSITVSQDFWRRKGIHYRMHPANFSCLQAAAIDCCVLANNHVMDWGYPGLSETLKTLHLAGIAHAGAGIDLESASVPAAIKLDESHRLLIFSWGMTDSGIPSSWAADKHKPGVNLLRDLSTSSLRQIVEQVQACKKSGDLAVASVHWGGNWGYTLTQAQQQFAHALIDEAAIDLVHGHSSHHPKGMEVYREKLILYGCGDLITDYEGISGHESYRNDLGLLYFPRLAYDSGKLLQVTLIPTQMKNFKLTHPPPIDAQWLQKVLTREGRRLGTALEVDKEAINSLQLLW